MDTWTRLLVQERMEKAKRVYERLEQVGWQKLSTHDRKLMDALGYMCLEVDDVKLADLTDALEDQ